MSFGLILVVTVLPLLLQINIYLCGPDNIVKKQTLLDVILSMTFLTPPPSDKHLNAFSRPRNYPSQPQIAVEFISVFT